MVSTNSVNTITRSPGCMAWNSRSHTLMAFSFASSSGLIRATRSMSTLTRRCSSLKSSSPMASASAAMASCSASCRAASSSSSPERYLRTRSPRAGGGHTVTASGQRVGPPPQRLGQCERAREGALAQHLERERLDLVRGTVASALERAEGPLGVAPQPLEDLLLPGGWADGDRAHAPAGRDRAGRVAAGDVALEPPDEERLDHARVEPTVVGRQVWLDELQEAGEALGVAVVRGGREEQQLTGPGCEEPG